MTPPLSVRPMVLADCPRVAEIRVRGWQTAYRGLIPQPYLDSLSVPEDADRRRAHFENAGEDVVNLVAERAGTVVGWACHGPYRDGERLTDDAELYALYVDAACFGSGVGHALLQETRRRLASRGRERLYLWVLRDNARARRFYERAGLAPDGAEEPFEAGGAQVPEVRYVGEVGG
ncbi:GNAT family N-acetyltransferase [Streptomyces niveiscabiei]|uniref:GNAT family N-acetyltransferase n=1 Tax=Streptomyces niveiscabiei TaxID=164115 RepID=UPI0029A4427D|nr:GNAT family N-acetyltransferase [Streptomyces niveiscabiei]MDX3380843.1 GNAT family N-acetyltransferase [Streptomyces niveiscabiei]